MKINDKHLAYFALSASSADLKGWLWKKGELNTSYQKRWCVLKGNLFFYFEKKNDKDPIGVIVLESCFVQLSEGGDSPYTFSIHFTGEGSRVYKLTADDEVSCTTWIKALSTCTYRYLKIIVDDLERKVKHLEVKKTLQTSSLKPLPSEFQKTSVVYAKAKPHGAKRFGKGLKKSKSMPSICNATARHDDEDEFLNFNIFPDDDKGLSKSHETLCQSKNLKLHKSVKNKESLLKRSPKFNKKKVSKTNKSKSMSESDLVPAAASNGDVKNRSSKVISFLTMHEQFRKEIYSFVTNQQL